MILEQVIEKFSQDMDSCAEGDMWNYLDIETHDAGAGPYIVLKTERWAMDFEEIDAFAQRLKDMVERVRKAQEERSV